MNTPTTNAAGNVFATRRDREVRTITAVIGAVCLLASVAAVIPAVEHALNTGLIALGALLALVLALRLGLRWLRERREDRADEITAAAWRATHPRPPGDTSTAAGSPGRATPAGVA